MEDQRKEFAIKVDLLMGLESKKSELIVDEDAYQRELDLLRFQINEIESAQLSDDEEESLEQAFQLATNSARLAELVSGVKELINGNEPSSYDLILSNFSNISIRFSLLLYNFNIVLKIIVTTL